MDFWSFLRPPAPGKSKLAPPPATAAELRDALAQAEAEADATEAAAAELARARAGQLLVGTDAEVDAADRRLALAQRAADRTAAAVEALRQKLAAAEQREQQESLDRLYGGGEAALQRGLALYGQYADAAASLARLVEQLPAVATEIEHANRLLRERGDARRVAGLDETARPEVSAIPQLRVPLWEQLRLPAGDAPHDSVWPTRREVRIPPMPVRLPAADALDEAALTREAGIVR
jgi:hypothetical protein